MHARLVLAEWHLGTVIDDAELLVSELLTNAVTANGAGVLALRLLADGRQLIIEVFDQCSDEPRPRQAGPQDDGGRGLLIVEAIARRWGVRRMATGKVVWAELVAG